MEQTPTLDGIFEMFEEKAKDVNVSDEELTFQLGAMLQKLEYERTPYNMNFSGLCRARSISANSIEAACEEFGHVKRLSYPPDECAVQSRCNLKGNSVFYCSSETGVPVFEVRPEINQYVALTVFTTRTGSDLKITLPIIGVQQIMNTFLLRDRTDHMVKMLADDMHYKSNNYLALAIDRRLANWFVQPIGESNKHIYRLTTAYYNALLKYSKVGDEKTQALIYPSVESEVTGYNLVMEKNLVDDNLKVEISHIYKLERKTGKILYLRPIKEIDQMDSDGKISWKQARLSRSMWILEPASPTISNLRFNS